MIATFAGLVLALSATVVCARAQSLPSTNRIPTLPRAASAPVIFKVRPAAANPSASTNKLTAKLFPSFPQAQRFVVAGTNLLSTPQPLKPGVYLSEPYSCIVIVPGAQADDGALIPPAEPVPPIPVVRPELRLVPR